MIGLDSGVKSRSDGLAGVRFLVKACVIVSFLVLVTGYNYYVTGEVPDLWNAGEGVSVGADEVLTFARRKLREEGGVRFDFFFFERGSLAFFEENFFSLFLPCYPYFRLYILCDICVSLSNLM